ncbi:MAG: hypothetical protein ACI4IK_00115 [Eubacterium sp.]
MKIKDIELDKIKQLLESVPDGIDCESITFDAGEYQLHLVAGTVNIKNVNFSQSLYDLRRILECACLPEGDSNE